MAIKTTVHLMSESIQAYLTGALGATIGFVNSVDWLILFSFLLVVAKFIPASFRAYDAITKRYKAHKKRKLQHGKRKKK